LRREDLMPFVCCDAYAVAVYLDPSMVTKSRDLYACVELGTGQARGAMLIDWFGQQKTTCQQNITAITHIDRDKFYQMLVNATHSPNPNQSL